MPIFPRYNGSPLMDRISSVENLTLAWRRVRSNIQVARRGRSAGPDAVTLHDFEADWANQMTRLAEELHQGTYRPLPPKRVAIPKASGGERAIAILAVRDRVAQRAVQQVLDPLFDPLFCDCSYGSRPHVGVPDALARLDRYAEQGLVWVVDADIHSYFDSLDQRILMGLVRQRIDDPLLLQLIARWLEVGALHTSEYAPLADSAGSRLWQRGSDMLHGLFQAEDPAPGYGTMPGFDAPDPYAAAQWETAVPANGLYGMAPAPRQSGVINQFWTAASMVQPAMQGVRYVLPHLQRIGTQRLLMAGALAAGAVAAGELALRVNSQTRRGTPQGGSLSPLLANVYLHPFDLALSSQGLRLLRFVDDFVVLCATEDDARRALALVERQLRTLRLSLNEEKTRIVHYHDGLEFLGAALAPRQRGPRMLEGVNSFEEAQTRLQNTARQVGKHSREASDRLRKRLRKSNT